MRIEITLGDSLTELIDHRGRTPKKLGGDFALSGVPVLSAQNVCDGRINNEEPRFVSEAMWHDWMPTKLAVGDVLLTSEAPLGEVAYLSNDAYYCLGQRLFALRADEVKLHGRYLYYALQGPWLRSELIGRATGTTVVGIRQSELRKAKLQVPDVQEQRAIAGVLGALDDKIEQNRRTAAKLEALARATFRAWFVDFAPVHAKAAGATSYPGLPPAAFAALPTIFTGSIPEGWEMKNIGDVVTIKGGATPSTTVDAYWDGGTHAWATPKDLSNLTLPVLLDTADHITDAGVECISSRLLPVGTVLMSSRAPVGYLAIGAMPMAINQGFIAMVCDGPLPNVYVLRWAESAMDAIRGNASGTTFPEISKKNFRPIPIVVPPRAVVEAFGEVAGPMHERLVAAERESRHLAALRDYLLPRLLSGKVRVR